MRNRLRVLAFDVLAPAAVVAALLYIGVALGWPLWWVAVCSVLCVLVVEGVIVNAVLARRDKVTFGTDDDGPGLRLAVVATTTAALVAAVAVGYTQWTRPDQTLRDDSAEVTGNPADNKFSVDYRKGGKLIAVDSVNDGRAHMMGRKRIAADLPEKVWSAITGL